MIDMLERRCESLQLRAETLERDCDTLARDNQSLQKQVSQHDEIQRALQTYVQSDMHHHLNAAQLIQLHEHGVQARLMLAQQHLQQELARQRHDIESEFQQSIRDEQARMQTRERDLQRRFEDEMRRERENMQRRVQERDAHSEAKEELQKLVQKLRRENEALRASHLQKTVEVQRLQTQLDRLETPTHEDTPLMRQAMLAATSDIARQLPRFKRHSTVRLIKPVVSARRAQISLQDMEDAPTALRNMQQIAKQHLSMSFYITVGRALRRINEPIRGDELEWMRRHAQPLLAAMYYMYVMAHSKQESMRHVFGNLSIEIYTYCTRAQTLLAGVLRRLKSLQTIVRLAKLQIASIPPTACPCEQPASCQLCKLQKLRNLLELTHIAQFADDEGGVADLQRTVNSIHSIVRATSPDMFEQTHVIETAVSMESVMLFEDESELMLHVCQQLLTLGNDYDGVPFVRYEGAQIHA